MSLQFRKSITIFPGFRINFSNSGVSASVGLPGSGVSYIQRVSYAKLVSGLVPSGSVTAASQVAANPVMPLQSPADEKEYPLWLALLMIGACGVTAATVSFALMN